MTNLISTYRIQFNKGFTFNDLECIIPYLRELGVKTIYASPIFKAVPGSMHGYDVTDPLQINPEIGNLEQLRTISRKLKEANMYWLQDIVPNHMAFHSDNTWLMDVLEKCKDSEYYSYFDMTVADHDKLMVPFLGSTLENVIADGQLSIVYRECGFGIKYGDLVFPINYNTYPLIFKDASEAPEAVTSLLRGLVEHDIERTKQQLASVCRSSDIGVYIQHLLDDINTDHRQLLFIAEEQYYRLCNWQETDVKINYRRFFTINGLISLNMQHEHVFEDHHKLVKQLIDEGTFQGIRIDHVDGLYNPTEYLERLRRLVGEDTYVVVEKILERGERLPAYWPIQGTTGYDFLGTVNNLFTNRKAKPFFNQYYNRNIEWVLQTGDEVHEKKSYILHEHMAGDLDNLYQLFCELELVTSDEVADIPAGVIKRAIGAMLVYCPVYRLYGDRFPLNGDEARMVAEILANIKAEGPLVGGIKILEQVLLEKPLTAELAYNERVAHFFMRCMQFSGPLMAKGVEDTLMYTHNSFIAHNEVGDEPTAFGIKVKVFHELMHVRQQEWPLAMNTTATHDTKRGADARARLNVLSDVPQDWLNQVAEWRKMNEQLNSNNAPDANEEYLIYEALVASYPLDGDEGFAERFKAYIEKALREAKRNTNWETPNAEYEQSVMRFIDGILSEASLFLPKFKEWIANLEIYSVVNSLCQQVLKFTCPGVPDVYQGGELWDLSMVDPDNRRLVDYDRRIQYLRELRQQQFKVEWNKDNISTGKLKLALTSRLLHLTGEQQELFALGDYIPLKVKGDRKGNVIAYARRYNNGCVVVVLPLHLATLCDEQQCSIDEIDWANTEVTLPPMLNYDYENVLAGLKVKGEKKIKLKHLFNMAPIAILKYEAPDNRRTAGILLPVFSLPSPFGIGDFGPGARAFIDFLHRSGQHNWQLLPLNPTDMGTYHSPYSSISSMAGNPLLISPEELAEEGLLEHKELKDYHLAEKHFIDYKKAEKAKYKLLEVAWNNYSGGGFPEMERRFAAYCNEEALWLEDFALYKVIKEHHEELPWFGWPEQYKKRDEEALRQFGAENQKEIDKVKWFQFIIAIQWEKIRGYCNEKGVRLIGDMPFYVSYDSADVWASAHLFNLDAEGRPTGVAGVPPDYFSEDGQLWGMPTFRWDVMKQDNYAWWVKRLHKNFELFDLVRLDHFRAFETYWEVPPTDTTARNGRWIAGPGMDFFDSVRKELGGLPLIAEDLGYEMEQVYKLRDKTGLPGMKVLQFAWGENLPVSVDAPHNYPRNCVVYTGTHDNNTTKGWYKHETRKPDHKRMKEYIGVDVDEDNVARVMARLAYASVADTVILPMQDVLGLDERDRMNTPGTIKDNWAWRLSEEALTEDVEKLLMEWTTLFKRR